MCVELFMFNLFLIGFIMIVTGCVLYIVPITLLIVTFICSMILFALIIGVVLNITSIWLNGSIILLTWIGSDTIIIVILMLVVLIFM